MSQASSEARNVAVLKEAYRHWSQSKGGSVDHWFGMLADHIKFGSVAQSPRGAEYLASYQGSDTLRQYFVGLTRDWEMIDYVAEQFVAQGDRVVMLGRCSWRFKANGKVVDTPKADAWRFADDGKAVEFFEYFDSAQLRDAVS